MLASKDAKLVVGHCHAGGKIKDGCICIDDDGKYKYRVFHFGKRTDISDDKNKTESTKYREDVYFDDIKYNIQPSKSANNLGHNNNNQKSKKNNVNNVEHSAGKGSDYGHHNNPIFKIMAMESKNKNDKNKTEQKKQENNNSGRQDDNNKKEQKKQDNKQDIQLYTFGSTNTATFNQPQPQNKEVSCEIVENCLSSIKECFGKNT